jgi:hypothetical protein
MTKHRGRAVLRQVCTGDTVTVPPTPTIAETSMHTQIACQAVHAGKLLTVSYDGYTRDVEVHAVGFTTEANAIMRVWQVRGGSTSGEPTGWKLLRLDEARAVAITSEASAAPRNGYRRDDSAMSRIICQV